MLSNDHCASVMDRLVLQGGYSLRGQAGEDVEVPGGLDYVQEIYIIRLGKKNERE